MAQNEITLIISGSFLIVAMLIMLESSRILHKTYKLKDKIHADLEETIQLRKVMLNERLGAQNVYDTSRISEAKN
jgi:Na+/melibiose symporter-like transporter